MLKEAVPGFFDFAPVRDSLEYQKFKDYIWQNPVKQFLAKSPGGIFLQLSKFLLHTSSSPTLCQQV